MRVLFIVKKRDDYCPEYGHGRDGYCDRLGGLYNSARFVVEMLNQHGVIARLVQVTDNNDIDREVHYFKPDTVVIEALWVVPSKFHELIPLHPRVEWIVRVHSEIPFLALEGMAMEWIADYVTFPKVSIGANSERATDDIRAVIRAKYGNHVADTRVHYLPNWYPSDECRKHIPDADPYHLHIGCFGAIRPFKNQLIQALAAIEFAACRHKLLRFHVNATRCEQQGDNVLKNLRALFHGTGALLVEHQWEGHEQFLKTMEEMDVSMSVSLSETFNIVSADAATSGVPLVVSSEISWASPTCYALPTETRSIVDALNRVTSPPHRWWAKKANMRRLRKYDRDSVSTWLRFLK